jgi:hypothetical protein
MKKFKLSIPSCVLGSLLISNVYAAEPPFSAHFDVSTPTVIENDKIVFDGVRVDGLGFSAAQDAFKLEYLFDYSSLNFIFQSTFQLYPAVGVFYKQYMVTEPTPAQPNYIVDGTAYQNGSKYSFSATAAKPFIATLNLKKGHYLNYLIQNVSTDYRATYIGNDIDNTWLGNTGNVYGGTRIIRLDGAYKFKIEPLNPSENLNFSLTLWNGNNKSLQSISSGSYLSASFKSATYEYAKYQTHLNEGDILEVPGGNDFELVLVDSIGRLMTKTPDAGIVYQAEKTDTYYLFISDVSKGTGRTYSGRISITPSTVRSARKQQNNVQSLTEITPVGTGN